MITSTGGAKEEICSPNWSQALDRIGTIAFGSTSVFSLTARPSLSAAMGVEVRVNGVIVPEVNPAPPGIRFWTFDAVNNSLTFLPFGQPAPGSTVTVSYITACIP